MVVATKQLHDWFETDAGHRVLACERDHLLPMVANYRPFRSLDMTRGLLLQDSLSRELVALTTESAVHSDNKTAQVVSDSGRLPFASESFDLVVCAHLHELSASAGEMVADMSRVLTSGGLCVFFGFNPHGIWRRSDYGNIDWWSCPSVPSDLQALGDMFLLKTLFCDHIGFGGLKKPAHPVSRLGMQMLKHTLPGASVLYRLVMRKQVLSRTGLLIDEVEAMRSASVG